MGLSEMLIFALEMVGTVAFSIAGGLVGIERGLDYFGILVLSVTTAVGGGMIRDLILGRTPPAMFINPIYVFVAICASVLILLMLHQKGNFVENGKFVSFMGLITFFDALGLGVFTVIGVNAAIEAGYHNAFLSVFVGVMTGVGGGMLRDILVRRTPLVMRREIYAVASIVGAVPYYYLQIHFTKTICMLLCAAVIVTIRLLSVRFHWNLPNSQIEGK